MPRNSWVSPLALARLLASHNTNKTLKTIKKKLRKPKLCSMAAPSEFCPKEPLNRSRNFITS